MHRAHTYTVAVVDLPIMSPSLGLAVFVELGAVPMAVVVICARRYLGPHPRWARGLWVLSFSSAVIAIHLTMHDRQYAGVAACLTVGFFLTGVAFNADDQEIIVTDQTGDDDDDGWDDDDPDEEPPWWPEFDQARSRWSVRELI